MDPTANLNEVRALATSILADERPLDEMERDDLESLANDGARLAELVQALDEWISNGGFLPNTWHRVKR